MCILQQTHIKILNPNYVPSQLLYHFSYIFVPAHSVWKMEKSPFSWSPNIPLYRIYILELNYYPILDGLRNCNAHIAHCAMQTGVKIKDDNIGSDRVRHPSADTSEFTQNCVQTGCNTKRDATLSPKSCLFLFGSLTSDKILLYYIICDPSEMSKLHFCLRLVFFFFLHRLLCTTVKEMH